MIDCLRPLARIAVLAHRLDVLDPVAPALVDRGDVVLDHLSAGAASNALVAMKLLHQLPFHGGVCALLSRLSDALGSKVSAALLGVRLAPLAPNLLLAAVLFKSLFFYKAANSSYYNFCLLSKVRLLNFQSQIFLYNHFYLGRQDTYHKI